MEKVQPMMKKIVVWSLECVQDAVTNRKHSSELFGYDFMIDENADPWLIEINSSPALDYSTVIFFFFNNVLENYREISQKNE